MKDGWCRIRAPTEAAAVRRSPVWLLVGLFGLAALTGCVRTRADLTTRINALGGGEHEAILAVPLDRYTPDVFDRLPDLSLITGIKVHDYRASGWRGVQITQSFYSLSRLSAEAGGAHFINQAYLGRPVVYRARWHPGAFVRELHVEVLIEPGRSQSLVEIVRFMVLSTVEARFILEMPGRVIEHNGQLLGEQAIAWQLDMRSRQTCRATARMVSIPFILAFGFASLGGGAVLAAGLGRRAPRPARPLPGLLVPAGRPAARVAPSARPRGPSARLPTGRVRRETSPILSVVLAIVLTLSGIGATALAVLSVLDGDWGPAVPVGVGVLACIWAGVWGRKA